MSFVTTAMLIMLKAHPEVAIHNNGLRNGILNLINKDHLNVLTANYYMNPYNNIGLNTVDVSITRNQSNSTQSLHKLNYNNLAMHYGLQSVTTPIGYNWHDKQSHLQQLAHIRNDLLTANLNIEISPETCDDKVMHGREENDGPTAIAKPNQPGLLVEQLFTNRFVSRTIGFNKLLPSLSDALSQDPGNSQHVFRKSSLANHYESIVHNEPKQSLKLFSRIEPIMSSSLFSNIMLVSKNLFTNQSLKQIASGAHNTNIQPKRDIDTSNQNIISKTYLSKQLISPQKVDKQSHNVGYHNVTVLHNVELSLPNANHESTHKPVNTNEHQKISNNAAQNHRYTELRQTNDNNTAQSIQAELEQRLLNLRIRNIQADAEADRRAALVKAQLEALEQQKRTQLIAESPINAVNSSTTNFDLLAQIRQGNTQLRKVKINTEPKHSTDPRQHFQNMLQKNLSESLQNGLKHVQSVKIKSQEPEHLVNLEAQLSTETDSARRATLEMQITELKKNSATVARVEKLVSSIKDHVVLTTPLSDDSKERVTNIQTVLKAIVPDSNKDEVVKQRIIHGNNRAALFAEIEAQREKAFAQMFEVEPVTANNSVAVSSNPESLFLQVPSVQTTVAQMIPVDVAPCQTAASTPPPPPLPTMRLTQPAVSKDSSIQKIRDIIKQSREKNMFTQANVVNNPANVTPTESIGLFGQLEQAMKANVDMRQAPSAQEEELHKVLAAHSQEIGLTEEQHDLLKTYSMAVKKFIVDKYWDKNDEEWNFEYAEDTDADEIIRKATKKYDDNQAVIEVQLLTPITAYATNTRVINKLQINKDSSDNVIQSIRHARPEVAAHEYVNETLKEKEEQIFPSNSALACLEAPNVPKPPSLPKPKAKSIKEIVIKTTTVVGQTLFDQIKAGSIAQLKPVQQHTNTSVLPEIENMSLCSMMAVTLTARRTATQYDFDDDSDDDDF